MSEDISSIICWASGGGVCRSPSRAASSVVNAIVWVKNPFWSMAIVPPMISGRIWRSPSIGSSIACRNFSESLSRPWMTCTNPASSRPPSSIIVTSSQSWKDTSPSKSVDVSCHHAPCSGRLELRSAASLESNRTTPTNSPSSVTPYVPPSQPDAPGSSSSRHRSICRWRASASVHLPWMTWMNTWRPPVGRGPLPGEVVHLSTVRRGGLGVTGTSRTRQDRPAAQADPGGGSRSGGEQHLADVPRRLELAVRVGGLLEREPGVDDGPHDTRLDERPHVLAHGRDDGRLLGGRAGAQARGDDGAALGEQHAEVELALPAALQPDGHEAAVRRKRVDVAGEVLRAHVVEDDVGAVAVRARTDLLDEVLLLVVDEHLGPELAARVELGLRPGGDGDVGADGLGQLDRHGADARAATVDEQPLAGLDVRGEEDVGPHGARDLGQARRVDEVDAAGHREQLALRDDDLLGVATALEQGAHLVADRPV